MKRNFRRISLFFLLITTFLVLNSKSIFAQAQNFDFSGSNPESYQCITNNGGVIDLVPDPDPVPPGATPPPSAWSTREEAFEHVDANGRFLCPLSERVDNNGDGVIDDDDAPAAIRQAVLKPAKLQQVEIWFLRVLYVIWALIASLSFFYLVVLGYQYMLTRGDVTKITEIRRKILNYILGLALVFLAVPILSTFFRLLSINDAVACYDVEMPGFQFFFNDLCTSPSDPCSNEALINGVIGARQSCNASEVGNILSCPGFLAQFCCTSSLTWQTHITGASCP